MTPRSYFVGATAFYPFRERRRWWRWYEAIARKGHTEPVEFLMALSMITGSFPLFTSYGDAVLVYPGRYAVALLIFGLLGLIGLTVRSSMVRVIFGFGGMFVRLWMALLYFVTDWHNPIWCSYAVSAMALSWIATRIVCKEAVRYHISHGLARRCPTVPDAYE